MCETSSMTIEATPIAPPLSSRTVMLCEGEVVSLDDLNPDQFDRLQWEQEQKFAQLILSHSKGSPERAQIVRRAYDTICTILSARAGCGHKPLVMGLDDRYVDLVLRLLQNQVRGGIKRPLLFEIGYGCGALLKKARQHGFEVAGIEVSATMRAQAMQLLGAEHSDVLLLGDIREVHESSLRDRPTLIYWNDVFEHICPDEISDYLTHIRRLLTPGGKLVTITPNWLLRPLDATALFCPPRTKARGLHLKEYRLSEVARLLMEANFRQVATPLLATHKRLIYCGSGGRGFKQAVEPLLDKVPVRLGRLLCRGFAMSCTIATK
jgi:SAM-dependent methyltransferase